MRARENPCYEIPAERYTQHLQSGGDDERDVRAYNNSLQDDVVLYGALARVLPLIEKKNGRIRVLSSGDRRQF